MPRTLPFIKVVRALLVIATVLAALGYAVPLVTGWQGPAVDRQVQGGLP